MENLTIDYYDSQTAAVQTSYMPDGGQGTDYRIRQSSDALIFANYALRMMRNLGDGADTKAVARMLSAWSYEPDALDHEGDQPHEYASKITVLDAHVHYTAALDMGLSPERAKQRYGDPVFLVPHKGKGRRRFVGTLRFPGHFPIFKLKTRGFGLGGVLSGKGIPQYGTDSIFVLLVHLAEIHNSREFLTAINGMARACGSAYLSGKITGFNCESLALAYMNDWFGGFMEHKEKKGYAWTFPVP